MPDSLDDFFDPERLNKKWIPPEPEAEPSSKPKQRPGEILNFFAQLLKSELGDKSAIYDSFVAAARELITEQESATEKELKENQAKLKEVFNQIENLLDAVYLTSRRR